MAMQSSGAISLSDVQDEWDGNNPINISEYYDVDSGVPASGEISLSDFYGTSSYVVPQWFSNFTLGVNVFDNFNSPRFTYDYVKPRTGNPSSTWPTSAGTVGLWIEDLGDDNVNAGGDPWLCVTGSNSAIKQYSRVRINGGTIYSGFWATYSVENLQRSQGTLGAPSQVTAFINSSAGAVVKSAMLGNSSLSLELFP